MKARRARFYRVLAVYVMLMSLSVYFYAMLARFAGFNREETSIFGLLLFVLLVGAGIYFLPRPAAKSSRSY